MMRTVFWLVAFFLAGICRADDQSLTPTGDVDSQSAWSAHLCASVSGIVIAGDGCWVCKVDPNGKEIWRTDEGCNTGIWQVVYNAKYNRYVIAETNGLVIIGANGVIVKRVQVSSFGWTPAVAPDGTIYVAGTALVALDGNGNILWREDLPEPAYVAPDAAYFLMIARNGDLIAVEGRTVLCYTGKTLKWECQLGQGRRNQNRSGALGDDGTIYCSCDTSLDAVGPDGVLKWSTAFEPVNISLYFDGPVVAKGYGIILPHGRCIYCFDFDGKLKWKFLAGGTIGGSAAVDRSGNVYFVTPTEGDFYRLNSRGELTGSADCGRIMNCRPVIDESGTGWIVNAEGKIYRFKTDGISPGPWAMGHADAANTNSLR